MLSWALLPLDGPAAELSGRVVSIADGDTLTVLVSRQQIKVRLTDIDAPERRQPFGQRSRQSLADLCARRDATVLKAGKTATAARSAGAVQQVLTWASGRKGAICLTRAI